MNISKTKSRVTSNRQAKKGTVILPYVSGLSEKITRILKSFDVQLYIGETGRNFKTSCAEHNCDLYQRNLAKIDDNNKNKKVLLSNML